jgi:hypothetical protein
MWKLARQQYKIVGASQLNRHAAIGQWELKTSSKTEIDFESGNLKRHLWR